VSGGDARRPALAACILCIAATLFGTVAARAADLTVGPPEGEMAIDLHVARDETGLRGRDGPVEVDMRLSRLGVTYAERFGEVVSLGLMGGWLSASQRGQDLTAGMRFTGNYAGVAARGAFAVAEPVRLGVHARFLYHWMDDAREGQRVQFDWAQLDLAATVQFRLRPALELYAGPVYSEVRLEQRARGAIDDTSEFEARRTTGVVGGILLEVEERGRVGLEVRRGTLDGVALSFQRQF